MKKQYLKSIGIALLIAFSIASYMYLNFSLADQMASDQALQLIEQNGKESTMFVDLGILKKTIAKVVEMITYSS